MYDISYIYQYGIGTMLFVAGTVVCMHTSQVCCPRILPVCLKPISASIRKLLS